MTQTRTPAKAGLAAYHLWSASFTFLVLMPFAMAIAHRSATLFVVIAAVLALSASAAEGNFETLLAGMKRRFLTLPGIMVLVFLGWALISMSWTWSLRVALFTFGELMLAALSGFVLVETLPQRMPTKLPVYAVWSVIAAAALVFFDIKSGMRIRQLVEAKAHSFVFNRTVLTLFLVMVPLLFLLWRRKGAASRLLGVAGAFVVVATTFNSSSGAATMAILIFIPVYLIAWMWPKMAVRLAGLCFALIFVTAPVFGTMFIKVMPHQIVDVFRSDHSIERIDLWRGFEYAIAQQPMLGGGFGVSPNIIKTPVIAHVPQELRGDINMGHPHNAAMQVWVEMGAVGAVITLLALFAMLRMLMRLPAAVIGEQLAWIAGATFVAIIGHGAWQGWWIAALGAGLTWFRRERLEAQSQ